jgi:CRISPR-associated protein Cmr6
MRQLLKRVGIPTHLGLAYNAWAPTEMDGKVSVEKREDWLVQLAEQALPSEYEGAYQQWKNSFTRSGDLYAEFVLDARLLVGHGNASATDVGITLHHTWGVPMIPGSALKGLLSHYLSSVYGPANEAGDFVNDQSRLPFKPVTWKGSRIIEGPGDMIRALFGAPDADQDEEMRGKGLKAGAEAGVLTFHDALYVPKNEENDKPLKPFAHDVITVHQKEYYDKFGGTWPNDYDNPNPIAFLSVRPKTRFLLALSGPSDWTELAAKLLTDALAEWGVGGKTSSGYGRGRIEGGWQSPPLPPSETLLGFMQWLDSQLCVVEGKEKTPQRQVADFLKELWVSRLRSLEAREKELVVKRIRKVLHTAKVLAERDSILASILQ